MHNAALQAAAAGGDISPLAFSPLAAEDAFARHDEVITSLPFFSTGTCNIHMVIGVRCLDSVACFSNLQACNCQSS